MLFLLHSIKVQLRNRKSLRGYGEGGVHLKIQINEDANLQDTEIIINCKQTNNEILKLIAMLRVMDCKLTGTKNQETYILDATQILYIDTVDKKTFFTPKQKCTRHRLNYMN